MRLVCDFVTTYGRWLTFACNSNCNRPRIATDKQHVEVAVAIHVRHRYRVRVRVVYALPPGSSILVGKVPSPALSSTRLALRKFPSSTSRSPSPSTSVTAIEYVDVLPPGSSILVGKVPSPALSSTRLALRKFPSSTSRSPSPSTDCVIPPLLLPLFFIVDGVVDLSALIQHFTSEFSLAQYCLSGVSTREILGYELPCIDLDVDESL